MFGLCYRSSVLAKCEPGIIQDKKITLHYPRGNGKTVTSTTDAFERIEWYNFTRHKASPSDSKISTCEMKTERGDGAGRMKLIDFSK